MNKSIEAKALRERVWLVDYLKAVAIILVITNHSLNEAAKDTWVFYFIVRMAVPIFVLVSGFNYTASIERMKSPFQWYSWERLLRKMTSYLLPMIAVFAIWCVKETIRGRFGIWYFLKAMVLQSYGSGAYYFLIAVQLYMIFPLVYGSIRKFGRGGGYLIILLVNLLYEIILYVFPIPISFYRVVGLRYLLLLAFGCWIHDCSKKGCFNVVQYRTKFLLVSSFAVGCCYIAFFSKNWEDTQIFRYTTWGNTNIFVCLYTVPIFYALFCHLSDRKIGNRIFHIVLSLIGRSTYYILCTQLIMFWYIDRVWSYFQLPLVVRILRNIMLGVVSGVVIQGLVGKIKSGTVFSDSPLRI